jgi:DNA-binding GntR family transcriptional regulator
MSRSPLVEQREGSDVTKTADESGAAEPTRVEECLARIRTMVLSGELLPGQKVHQAELADQLGISRIPVREALATLHAEGVLVHKPNTGFTVARFSGEDLSEIYLMRRLLETELLRSLDMAVVDLAAMVRINRQMKAIGSAENRDEYQKLNRQFHFLLFDASPLRLIRQEVSKLWYMSGFYRSLYLYETDSFAHLSHEHDNILDAVRARDVKRLIKEADTHRSGTERLVVQRLGRGRGA